MKKRFIIFIFIIFLFSFFSKNIHIARAVSDGINVNLNVEGCNNNGICEAVTGETALNCPNDCSALPPPVPTPSPGPTGGGRILPPILPVLDITPPQNPLDFRAVAGINGIGLFWTNPPDEDFSYVRIMRNEDRFHGDPFWGTLIYEGNKQYFLDTKVTSGKKYFYTLFARDTTGNFSSGSAASAIAFSLIKNIIPPIIPIENNLPEITPPAYLVHQYNKMVEPFSNTSPVIINNLDNTIIDTEIEARLDDYLIVTEPNGEKLGQYMFSFNKNSGRYESIIPPLQNKGTYTITIFRYKENNPEILTKGLLNVIPNLIQKTETPKPNICNVYNCNIIQYVVIILLLLFLFLLLRINKLSKKTPPVDN